MRGSEICESSCERKDLSLPQEYEEEEYDFDQLDEEENFEIILSDPYGDDSTRNSFIFDPSGDIQPGIICTKEEVMAMTFSTEVEAFEWYNLYALMLGFGIRRCNCKYFNPETKDSIKSRIFVCARQGKRSEKWLYLENRKREHTRNIRVVCKSRVRILRASPNEPFRVTHFEPNHSHNLSEAQCTSNYRSHRHVSEADVEHIRSLKEVGIKYCQGFLLMVKQSGGYGQLGYTMKDLYNKMASLDKLYSNKGDGQETLRFIDSLGESHYGIFKRFILGENNELQSLFWCDRRSMVDYMRFGDVLVFDATYKTNMYLKPFVILSGVNNHFQTIVFACAILNDEKTPTYEWVLKCLMEAMNNKKPLSVITDGDLAMRGAIVKIFPEARHRLCSWHLCRNAKSNLKLPTEFMSDFTKCMRSRKPENYWHDDWHAMINKWNIADRNWIQLAYLNRKLWAETYLKFDFFALQTTTSRCESINSFFKDFMSFSDKLIDVCRGFMIGVDKLRNNERKEHFLSDQSDPIVTTEYKDLERHAAEVFTRNIYEIFRTQARKGEDYRLLKVENVEEHSLDFFYVMKGEIKKSLQVVQCLQNNKHLRCTCFRWETSFMICKHILFVLRFKGVSKIPKSLIAERWVKTDKKFYATEPSMREPVPKPCDDPDVQSFRRGSIKSQVELYVNLGCRSSEAMKFFKEHLGEGIRKLQNIASKAVRGTQGSAKKEENPYAHVKNPKAPDTKCQKGVKKDKRKKCGNCGELGHNRSTCRNPPVQVVEDVEEPEDNSQQIPSEFDANDEFFWSKPYSYSQNHTHEDNYE